MPNLGRIAHITLSKNATSLSELGEVSNNGVKIWNRPLKTSWARLGRFFNEQIGFSSFFGYISGQH